MKLSSEVEIFFKCTMCSKQSIDSWRLACTSQALRCVHEPYLCISTLKVDVSASSWHHSQGKYSLVYVWRNHFFKSRFQLSLEKQFESYCMSQGQFLSTLGSRIVCPLCLSEPWLFHFSLCFTFFFFFSTCSQMDSILRSLTLTPGWSWLEWGFWLAVNHWRRHLPLLRSLAGSFSCHWPEIDGLTSHSPERSHYRLTKSSPCSVSIGCILHSLNVKR